MSQLELLQAYWWLLISVLGAALVFLLFVQGGQSLLCSAHTETERQLMVNSLGRKWELTFTTLVVFGGAFFASFPLFLFHQFRRRLLAVDAHSRELRSPGCELRVSP